MKLLKSIKKEAKIDKGLQMSKDIKPREKLLTSDNPKMVGTED